MLTSIWPRKFALVAGAFLALAGAAAAQEADPDFNAPGELQQRDEPADAQPRLRPEGPRFPASNDAHPHRDARHGLPAGPHRPPFRGGPGGPMQPGMMFERELEYLRQHDPEMYELEKSDRDMEKTTFDLVQLFRQAPAEKRDEVKARLEEHVQIHFDVRQKRRMLQIQRLEEELQRLRDSIVRRQQARYEIIIRRVSELVGEEDDLGF